MTSSLPFATRAKSAINRVTFIAAGALQLTNAGVDREVDACESCSWNPDPLRFDAAPDRRPRGRADAVDPRTERDSIASVAGRTDSCNRLAVADEHEPDVRRGLVTWLPDDADRQHRASHDDSPQPAARTGVRRTRGERDQGSDAAETPHPHMVGVDRLASCQRGLTCSTS